MSQILKKKAIISSVIFIVAIVAITAFLIIFSIIKIGKGSVIKDFSDMKQATVENYKELKKTDYYIIIYDEDSYKHELIKEIVIEYANYVRTTGNATPIYAMDYNENLDISNSNHLNFSQTELANKIPTLIKVSNGAVVSADTKTTVSTINQVLTTEMNK